MIHPIKNPTFKQIDNSSIDNSKFDSDPNQASQNNQMGGTSNNNYKRITSLDEIYVEKNYFSVNSKDPYQGNEIDFESKGIIVELIEL